jgi:diguanylate cyclase (GGDEF)-like protein/putative nucleotidyltransferase with HDIG domain
MKQLPIPARLFLIFTYILGAFILAHNTLTLKATEPLLLGILCLLGATLHILKVEGATNRSHYTLSFLVFGFTLAHLGMPEAILVILVSNLAEWIWNRPAWYIQLFNISCYLIAAEIAGLIYSAINPLSITTSWEAILAIAVGMAGFTFINHLLVGVIVWLARRENFKQSGIFDPIPLLIDLTMMSVGASLAIVWAYNPYALLIFLIPSYPLYMALRIPELERKSETDQKTGLFNHHHFMAQFNNELQRANRYDRPLSIIMADLDLLRNINNTYGHLAGDDVLKGVADILKQTVREYDLVARFGGEEFAILMPEAEIDKAIERAEHIRKAIESARFVVPTSVQPIKVTMSFGISKRENFEQSPEEIIHHADTALYRSKLNGRNTSLALINNSFLKAGSTESAQPTIEDINATQVIHEDEKLTSDYAAAATIYLKQTPEPDMKSAGPVGHSEGKPEGTVNSRKPFASHVSVQNYISLLSVSAIIALLITLKLSTEVIAAYSPVHWLGFAAIAFTIILTEWFSISLYVRNTSLSTSAVPIIALVILFGPLGTLVASLVFALTAAVKFRSPFNRIIFNFSNHVIAGTIINVLIYWKGTESLSWENPLLELIIALAASLILFIFTTTLISIGIGIDVKQSPHVIWKEQYQWMAPYYLGMGFISYALMFGYAYADLLGILTMLIPMSLLRISQAQYVEHTRVVVNELRQKNHELEGSSIEIGELNEGLLETLSEVIDLRDPYVLGHSRLVSQYAADIARRMKLSERQIELIRKAGLLHDIGKLGISMEILTKPGQLTREEFEIIKDHAALGGDLVKNSPSLRPLASIIRHHHEFYNGEGYPDNLSGNQISIEARIVAVADAIEAMSSDRPYRKALQIDRIIRELRDHSGTQFDPLAIGAAIAMLEAMSVGERAASSRSDTQLRISQRFAMEARTT